jgi:hypothetical protein
MLNKKNSFWDWCITGIYMDKKKFDDMNGGEAMNVFKKFYYLFALGFALFFLALQVYFHFTPNENDLLLKKIRSKTIKSTVIRKSIDHSDHNAKYIVYGKNDSLGVYLGWYEKTEIGDSIIKPKGTLKIIIKNSTKIDTMDYAK